MNLFGGIADKIVEIFAGILRSIYDSLMKPFEDLPTLRNLIFGTATDGKNSLWFDETLIWGIFNENEFVGAFAPSYHLMTAIAGFFLVSFIGIAGMRIASSSMNANKRNELFDFTKDLIFVGFLLYWLPSVYGLLFDINGMIVGIFKSATYEATFDERVEIVTEVITGDGMGDLIGLLLVGLVQLGLSIWAAFYYLVRKLTLLILLGMGPLMVVLWLLPQWKGVSMVWAKEVTSSIFIQSLHAFVFWNIYIVSAQSGNIVTQVLCFILFIPLTESLRNLLGMGGGMQGNLAKAGSMMGLGAIAAIGGAVKGAVNGESVMGSLKGFGKSAYNSIKNGGTGDSTEGKSSDVAGDQQAMNFANSKAAKMLKSGEFWSKAGKAVLGGAGSVAGAGIGPVGSIAMAEMGGMIGDAAGGLAGRTVSAIGRDGIERGKAGVDSLKAAQKNGVENEVMENAIHSEMAKTWAADNRESTIAKLQEQFPSASPQEIEKKFDALAAQKTEGLKTEAQSMWRSAKKIANAKDGDAEKLINSSAESMAQQWGKDNENAFNKDYESKNPRATGESQDAFENRRSAALTARQNEMKSNFIKDGNVFANANKNAQGEVNSADLARFMGSAAKEHKDAGVTVNLEDAATDGMSHVTGIALFDKGGKPNMQVLGASLASAKTERDKQTYISEQVQKGVPEETARAEWSKMEPAQFGKNASQFTSAGFQQSIAGKVVPLPENKLQDIAQQTTAFATGVLGKENAQNLSNIVKAAAISNPTQRTAAFESMVDKHIEQHGGDAVGALNSAQQKAGLAAGMVFGRAGLAKAQGLVANSGLYTQKMQSQINSPSEILQMAHKVQDDNGNMVVAPGAIRQVVSREGSHVEVRTGTGEVRTVSRLGAGSEELAQGQRIYQDLTSLDGQTLSLAKVNGSNTSVYQMDSGGTRIPSAIPIVQNPVSLLGNVNSPEHGPVQRQQMPIFDQRVESGKFYAEDTNGMENIRMVVDKGQRYMAADKGGASYRISPITAGDTRLNANETVEIPMVYGNGKLQPLKADNGKDIQATKMVQVQQVVTQTVKQNIVNSDGTFGTRSLTEENVNVLRNEKNEQQQGTVIKNIVKTVERAGAGKMSRNGEDINITVSEESYRPNFDLNEQPLLESKYRQRAERNVYRRDKRDTYGKLQGGFN